MTHILVVEDDPVIRSLIVEVLTDEGYDTLEAEDGQTGCTLAHNYQPDLILMDINLPVLDGATAIKRLKQDAATATIRTIAMSAGTTLRIHADDLPADGVLAKPFDLDTLLALVAVESRLPGTADLGARRRFE